VVLVETLVMVETSVQVALAHAPRERSYAVLCVSISTKMLTTAVLATKLVVHKKAAPQENASNLVQKITNSVVANV